MESPRLFTSQELREAAVQKFITSRVDSRLIRHLAAAADNIIPCDKSMMPAQLKKAAAAAAQHTIPTPPTTPELRPVQPEDPALPSVEQFIRKLVESSNVQVATLMPTLVYLERLKTKLQPMSRGLRCTSHRIFLACLILAAKNVNDISPKNKHWARYTNFDGPGFHFGFCTSEVNLMEKQLLGLLNWDLRLTERELYDTWEDYLQPIHGKIEYENRRAYHTWCQENAARLRTSIDQYSAATAAAAGGYYGMPPTPPEYHYNSVGSNSQQLSPAYSRGSVSPPALSYASSSASSTASSSRPSSRATTPTSSVSGDYAVLYTPSSAVEYEYPVKDHKKRLLPYEITPEQALAREHGIRTKIPRGSRGVFSRVFGSAMTAR